MIAKLANIGRAVALLLCAHVALADYPSPSMREKNYGRGGSCAYAAATTMLRVEGYPQSASIVRKNFRHGVSIQKLAYVLHERGFNVRANFHGDVRFLEMYDTAVIDFGEKHAVLFCGFYSNGQYAVISDPNHKSLDIFTKADFVRKWQRGRGRAVAIKVGN